MSSAKPCPAPSPAPSRAAALAGVVLFTALQRAAEWLIPAPLAMTMRVTSYWNTHLIRVAAHLAIADRVAAGPRTAAELAAEVGANEDALHRVLRALATLGVFTMDAQGRVGNNRLSETLREGSPGSMRDAARYFGSRSNLAAWSDIDASVLTGEPAFARVHGMSVWDWFARHDDESRAFAGTMTALTEQAAPSIAAAYDFGRHARVCDVAGGRGTLLAEILVRHPSVRGVLFDEKHVLDTAEPYLASRGVSGRVERVAGSFFERVPDGCDAYVLKDILHDWDDARCRTILANVKRAMTPTATLLLGETLVDRCSTLAPGPLIDVQMLIACEGGRQRSEQEMGALLASVGLRMQRVHATATPSSVVEVKLA